MRKILFLLIAFGISMACLLNAHASSFKLSLNGESNFDEEIILTLKIDELEGFTGSCDGLCGLVSTLEYDSSKIEITEVSALESFTLAQGKKLVLYKSTGVRKGKSILTIKAKNKTLKAGEETTISLKDIVVSDGEKDISGSNISKKIKLNNKVEENKTTETKPVENKKPASNMKEEQVKSSDNSLSEITLSNGTIEFNKDVLDYNVSVKNDVTEIVIGAKTSDSKAKILGDGTKKLTEGNNKVELVVEAEDGSKKIYILNIYREKEKSKDNQNKENLEREEVVENKEIENNSSMLITVIIVSFLVVVVGLLVFSNKKK